MKIITNRFDQLPIGGCGNFCTDFLTNPSRRATTGQALALSRPAAFVRSILPVAFTSRPRLAYASYLSQQSWANPKLTLTNDRKTTNIVRLFPPRPFPSPVAPLKRVTRYIWLNNYTFLSVYKLIKNRYESHSPGTKSNCNCVLNMAGAVLTLSHGSLPCHRASSKRI